MLNAGASQALSATFTPTDTADYTSSTATVSINVTAGSLTTTVLTTPQGQDNPAQFGEAVSFTATVAWNGINSVLPTGTVTFVDSSTLLGTAAVDSSGTATYATASLDVAGSPHFITAVYGGDNDNSPSTAAALAQTVS